MPIWLSVSFPFSDMGGSKKFMDERNHSSVFDPVGQQLKQFGVVNRIEEFRQVKIHHPYVPFIGVIKRFLYGRMAASIGAEAMTVLAEYGFVLSAQFLCYRLLNETVDRSWDSQRPEFAFLLLWDKNSTNGLGVVFPRLYGLHYLRSVLAQVSRELTDGHAVDPRTSPVCLDSSPSLVEVPSFKDGF